MRPYRLGCASVPEYHPTTSLVLKEVRDVPHQRDRAAADGSYRVSAWDDRRGHGTVWVYDADDEFVELGVVLHWPQERWKAT